MTLEHYPRVTVLSERTNRHVYTAAALTNITTIYQFIGDLADAMKYTDHTTEIYSENRDADWG